MEYTKLLLTVISTFFHSSCKNWPSSSIFDSFRFSTCRLNMDHMFSIGLTSGLLLGQSIVWGTSSAKNCFATPLVFPIVTLLISPPTSKLLFFSTKKMFSKYFNVKKTIHDCSKRMARYLTLDTKSSPHHNFLFILRNSFFLLEHIWTNDESCF